MSKSFTRQALAGALLVLSATAQAGLPTNLYFQNNTNTSFSAYTAGQPGATINAHTADLSVPYIAVMLRCNSGGKPNACPIDFYDKDSGEKIASVTMDTKSAAISAAPVFYGNYADKFTISGWDSKPLERIVINETVNTGN